ncbi:MAG: hypothetical protein BWX86_01713 [Verrucomicrobia bacterium ADurb.Bin122]|nr:MAG: hypothetical protein BWX86_01713 [Verrucomicrobia bacterium ADurb.Bin122]
MRHAAEQLAHDFFFHLPGVPVLALHQDGPAVFRCDQIDASIRLGTTEPLHGKPLRTEHRRAKFLELVPVDLLQALVNQRLAPRRGLRFQFYDS